MRLKEIPKSIALYLDGENIHPDFVQHETPSLPKPHASLGYGVGINGLICDNMTWRMRGFYEKTTSLSENKEDKERMMIESMKRLQARMPLYNRGILPLSMNSQISYDRMMLFELNMHPKIDAFYTPLMFIKSDLRKEHKRLEEILLKFKLR